MPFTAPSDWLDMSAAVPCRESQPVWEDTLDDGVSSSIMRVGKWCMYRISMNAPLHPISICTVKPNHHWSATSTLPPWFDRWTWYSLLFHDYSRLWQSIIRGVFQPFLSDLQAIHLWSCCFQDGPLGSRCSRSTKWCCVDLSSGFQVFALECCTFI